ncbi:hypothetical protein D9757_008389 [Collybiopsis confluens]|uniref:Major facilitator superfamily (MFS) profile domain-containing protein n=1 Tax=Collybiopsis confluens TaxID=2823264 RepID=A0A8H5HHK3_9AGAR|nr:hypothetical protein D9757_008389 [Collybiopsis confluens]
MVLGRESTIRSDGVCVIGLKSFATIPLIVYDFSLNIFLTGMFLWPLWISNPISTRLRSVAKRTLYGATISLFSSAINIIVMLVLSGNELGWVCISSCISDVAVNSFAIFWVSSSSHSSEVVRDRFSLPTMDLSALTFVQGELNGASGADSHTPKNTRQSGIPVALAVPEEYYDYIPPEHRHIPLDFDVEKSLPLPEANDSLSIRNLETSQEVQSESQAQVPPRTDPVVGLAEHEFPHPDRGRDLKHGVDDSAFLRCQWSLFQTTTIRSKSTAMTSVSTESIAENIRMSRLGSHQARFTTNTNLNDGTQSNEDGEQSLAAGISQHKPPTRTYQAMLLLAGSMMIFHVVGINQVFGIFQEFYTSPASNIKDGQGQDALVSLVGSIGAGLTWSGSIFMNPLMTRAKNIQLITFAGAVVMSAGLVLASFATRIWHLYLTQAILYGLGSSMYYFPLLSIAPTYFDRHRGFAMGFILAGSGIGGLVMALVLQFLLDHYGVQWALRILGIWNLVVAIPVSLVVKQRPGYGQSSQGSGAASRIRSTVNSTLLRKGTFWYQSFGAFLQAGGNVVPLYFMSSYTVSVLSLSRSRGSTFVSIFSGVNSLSRISMGILADYVGRQNTLIGGAFLSAVAVFALWYDAPEARFTVFVVMYGVYAGGYNALLPTTIAEIYGVENYHGVNGVLYFIRGLGSMFGAPIAGVILGTHSRSTASSMGSGFIKRRYNEVVIFDGMLLLAATFCVVYVRWLDARDKGGWRWKA